MGASPGGAAAGSPDDVVLPMPPQAPRTRSGPALRWVARTLLRLGGWRMAGTLPDLPKLVLIGAPHSSNWDGVWGMLVKVALGLDIRIFAKRELFWWPLGPILRRMGVIPVDRNAARGLIEQMLERFQQEDRFWLGIAPEGTRKRVERWKPGFWKIASAAGVPVLPAYFHYPEKIIGIGEPFQLTDDMDADMARIRAWYAPWRGKHHGV
ncbi:MAG: lysophospholipid acyltransferase family protein [Xanthomonadaceae bacterium]|nr:lysophospholipid acyltransferase family protein [Xanthomonadaceae bacterium]